MLPLGVVAYPSVVGSTTPLRDDSPAFWKKPRASRLKRALSNQRKSSLDAASTCARRRFSLHAPSLSSVTSEQPSEPDPVPSQARPRPKHVPIVIPRYVPIVAPDSPCDSVRLSSSRTSTVISSESPSLSDFPSPTRKYAGDSASLRSRHVEIVIPDWILPIQRFSASPIHLPLGFAHLEPPPPAKRSSPASMSGQTPNTSRTNTIDSQVSAPSPSQLYPDSFRSGHGAYMSSVNSSQTSLHRQETQDGMTHERPLTSSARTPGSGIAPSPSLLQTAGLGTPSTSTSGLSGLVCNVHRTTGREPHPLVGATTTILGDKLYVFGGRKLSRTRPQLTSDLYELDLVRRHWTKIDAKGDIPPPRYFHSVCALGDTKLVCYGGMSPAAAHNQQPPGYAQAPPADGQPEVVVMSDIHIYDVPTRKWMYIATSEAPQGRYAHCATILPSSAVFSSADAPLASIMHNPQSANPNQGSIGVEVDGEGGAEMVVVGGQDSANHYIEQISVFNLRSLKWIATNNLGRSCGAYRSVVAPLTNIDPTKIGTGVRKGELDSEDDHDSVNNGAPTSMLIYSNYNFLDVRLELQVRHPDGTLSEKPMNGNFSPPGLRFPNGGVINNHFVVSGTFLTSSKQEYALWALDLRTLTWGRIEAGGSIFSQGSWNRGVLWNRRNSFVILGNRKRSLVEDYNHRRINFSNICVVELEAFGLYDNPRKMVPNSAFRSVSAPAQSDGLDTKAGGRHLTRAASNLGQLALSMREFADMDFLTISGERIPVNSRVVARRWGPYFNHLLRESMTTQEPSDTATLRPNTTSHPSRNSSMTITPSIRTNYSVATTLTNNTATSGETVTSSSNIHSAFSPPDPSAQPAQRRPRTLYLPHTHLTVQALIHFLYTSTLPPPHSPLCSPQVLCSLLQLARPYHIDGLLESIIERLHLLLDNRNTAAIFNAAAMAAGGGDGVAFQGVNGVSTNGTTNGFLDPGHSHNHIPNGVHHQASTRSLDQSLQGLRINTNVDGEGDGRDAQLDADEVSSATSHSTSASASDSGIGSEREVWCGELSAVVGLQKRGLRGLMEGRRMREMGRGQPPGQQGGLHRMASREDLGGRVNGASGEGVGLGLS